MSLFWSKILDFDCLYKKVSLLEIQIAIDNHENGHIDLDRQKTKQILDE